ncbi:hypothetical protein [Lacticaseibacillus sp. 866-1]|uniref:hypothetical protein n=1 Tax=Lacticaseibacillus sp. 866-1 TaxID=2799576 RepID=UPI00194076F5|nr:hypothetical protein [Lacticaseibacillus sp. 866-1]
MANYTEALMTAPKSGITTTYLFKLANTHASWRPCGAPFSHYMASYTGVIRRGSDGKPLTTHLNNGGYSVVSVLRDDGHQTTTTVSRLTALAWRMNPLGLSDCDHRDDDSANNSASNLQWLSHRDNLRKRSIKSGKHPVISIDISTGDRVKYPSISAAAEYCGVSYPTVRGICRGEYTLPSASGYNFIFA